MPVFPTAVEAPANPAPRAPKHPGRPARQTRTFQLVLGLGAAWLGPALAYRAGLAVVLPPLIILGTATLLRGGRTLVDRLMLAVALLLGATCVCGLLFALWPWGMHPVPVAGCALSGLVLLSVLADRRPKLPNPTLGDGLTVAAAVAVTALVAWPLVRAGEVGRLAIALGGEDLARHVTLFDTIRHVGGYAFQAPDAAAEWSYSGMVTYPQGSHLVAALLDNFLRSSPTAYGSGLSAMNHYLGFHVLGYGLLTLSLLWASQWLVGNALPLSRRIVLVSVVTGLCLAGDLLHHVPHGYPSAVAGLTAMVLLTAVLARGVSRTRQQLITVAGLVVAVGFTYYLFLPAAGLAVLWWLFTNRRRVRRCRRTAVVVAVLAAPIAAFPLVTGVMLAGQMDALLRNGALRPSRDLLLAMVCVVLAGVLYSRRYRSPVWRSYLGTLGAAVALSGTLTVVQHVFGDGSGYYANKSLRLVGALLIVGLGVLMVCLPVPRRRSGRDSRPAAVTWPTVLVLASLAGVFGLVRGDTPYQPVDDTTWVRAWHRQRGDVPRAQSILYLLRSYPPAEPMPVFVLADDPFGSYAQTLFLSTLQRTAGRSAPGVYIDAPIGTPDRLERQIARVADPVTVLVVSADRLAAAQDMARRHPDRDIRVIFARR